MGLVGFHPPLHPPPLLVCHLLPFVCGRVSDRVGQHRVGGLWQITATVKEDEGESEIA